MKKTAYLLLLSIMISIFSLTVHSIEPKTSSEPSTLPISDLSGLVGVTPVNSVVQRHIYTEEQKILAQDETDTGFISASRSDYRSGDLVGFSLKLPAAVNLYDCKTICFDYYIPEPTNDSENKLSVLQYILTVTFCNEENEYTIRASAEAGEWNLAEIPLEGWNGRTNFTALKISLTAVYNSADMINLSFMADNVTAVTGADTTVEDTFMTSSFSVSGASLYYNTEKNTFVIRTNSLVSSLTGTTVYGHPEEIADHNTLRLAYSVSDDVKFKFLFSYHDGTGTIGEYIDAAKTNSVKSLYITLPDAKELKTFSIMIESRSGTVINLHSVDTLYFPDINAETELPEGSLDVCSLGADGSLNLRGSIPSDIVAANLKGSLLVYAVPLYEDPAKYVTEHTHIVEAPMSTRYNITVPKASLPYGSGSLLYTVFVKSGDELIMIGSPSLPDTKNAGVADERNKSIKGIVSDSLTAADNAAVTEITLDLSILFDDTTTGRIYSSFGRLYYFNTEYLKTLDAKIKSLSLSGTDIYLRLVKTVPSAAGSSKAQYTAISADTDEEFAALYSVIDFITDRYSSKDYGFVSGIIIGNSHLDPHPTSVTPDDYALSLIRTAATVYGAAGINIRDVRILLPLGDHYVSPTITDNGDVELFLTLFSYYTKEYGLSPYGILWQTDSIPEMGSIGIDGVQELKNKTDKLKGTPPSYYFIEYTMRSQYYYASEAVYDYLNAYYTASESPAVSSFIFKFSTPLKDEMWSEFARYYSLIDTDNIGEVENYLIRNLTTPPTLTESAKVKAHPFTYLKNSSKDSVGEHIAGTYKLFDYEKSFDTGGWFSVGVNGECSTVKSQNRRVMRAADGGIMYSSPTSLDLSSAPIISINAFSKESASYRFVMYSKKGRFESSFKTSSSPSVSYVDISAFKGADSVYSILILPEDEKTVLYVSDISCRSFDFTDSELSEFFESTAEGESVIKEPEANVVEILAFIFIAVVLSAAAFAVLRRK